jgi:dTDP-4-amino-4,6-dideoxygalactose transaminase
MDELQAAVLRIKLRHLDAWNRRRRVLAELYATELRGVTLVAVTPGGQSVHHLFPVLAERRDALVDHLGAHCVQALIHYPVPLHLQPCFRGWGLGPGSFPVAEAAAARLVSLPMFPQLRDDEARRVAAVVRDFHA